MFSLSQESYHLVPTQKAPRVIFFFGGGKFPWVTLMCFQDVFVEIPGYVFVS